MGTLLRQRWREWNRYRYLSDSERRLNVGLWVLFWLAVVCAVLQHVAFAHWTEVIPDGARWGEIVYDSAVAYAGAFTFYLLVVRLPLRRDRRNVCLYLAPLVKRIVTLTDQLMTSLNQSAGVLDPQRRNTFEYVTETCGKISYASEAPIMLVNPTGGYSQGTVFNVLRDHVTRVRDTNREVLALGGFVSSDLVKCIVAIEQCALFVVVDAMTQLGQHVTAQMSSQTDSLFQYLRLVDRLNRYREKHLPAVFPVPIELLPGVGEVSEEVPLDGFRPD